MRTCSFQAHNEANEEQHKKITIQIVEILKEAEVRPVGCVPFCEVNVTGDIET